MALTFFQKLIVCCNLDEILKCEIFSSSLSCGAINYDIAKYIVLVCVLQLFTASILNIYKITNGTVGIGTCGEAASEPLAKSAFIYHAG